NWSRTLLLAGACTVASAVSGIAPAQAETLKEALAQAYLTNPSLQVARANLRATDENVPIRRADALPSLNGTVGYTEYLYQSGSNPGPDRQGNGQVTLGVPVYAGGSVRNGIRAAETRVLAGRADLRGSESGLFSRVVAAYMDVIQNEAIVSLSRNNVQVLQVNLQATSDRFQIGDLTRTDVAQSQARLALAQGDLRTAEANLIRARENYVALVGAAPTNLEVPPALPGLPASPDDAVDVALQNNPDLLGAKERATAAGIDIRVAEAARLPRIDLTAGGTYSDYLGSLPGSMAAITPGSSRAATAGVRATIPLFQGGRPAAQVRQAQARSAAALEQAIGTERDVISQVRAAYSSWRASSAIIASTQSAVDAASLSLEGVRAENTVGNRTILDILNAQQELLRAQVQLVTARRNAYVAGFTVLAAMGRAEARDLNLEGTGPLYDPVANYDRVRGNVWDWSHNPDPVAVSTRTVDIPAQGGDIPDQRQAR
ncbi:MAG: hypothetical protein RLZZ08_781, partial [Pseudomonadota bacterium]